MTTPLTEKQIQAALAGLSGWSFERDALQKTFEAGDFREAIGFIVRLSFAAEAADHHPELTNVYNRITVRLTTHDAGNRITAKDVALAKSIESFSWL